MRRGRSDLRLGAAVACLVTGCGAGGGDRGGVVQVFIDTDAPVAGGEAFGAPPALFDRVRIDVSSPGSSEPCEGCSRIGALDHATLAAGALSFGIGLPSSAAGTRIRARAYRSEVFRDGEPTEHASLDVTFELPAVAEDESIDVTLLLSTEDTGRPGAAFEPPRAAKRGRPLGDRVGTWAPAQRVPCSGTSWPGQVCVPGGAFWMPAPFGDSLGTFPDDDQLVVLSPFFIDATETTVRSVLRSGLLLDPESLAGWSGDEEGAEYGAFLDWCTFSGNADRLDRPVNCTKPRWARQYCWSRSADLPTEAQVAYLIGGLASRRVPWGNEEAGCDDAWLERVNFDGLGTDHVQHTPLPCASLPFESVRAVGTSARDRVELETGTIEDILGNVAELTRDLFTTAELPCWQAPWIVDPFCDPAAVPEAPLAGRGGSLTSYAAISNRNRGGIPLDAFAVDLGFRCARAGHDALPAPAELDLVLGQGCVEDADCGSSPLARCIGPEDTWPSGGIAGGYCTRDCETDFDCGVDGGDCVQGSCLLRCDPDEPELLAVNHPLWPTKCRGRSDLVCWEPYSPSGVCTGACSTDAQCGDRYCDPKLGGCVDAAPEGAPDGTPCVSHPDCKGYCVGQTAGVDKFCASICSAGGELDSDDCGGSAHALCNANYQNSAGSLGYCYVECASHADCAQPITFCVPSTIESPDELPLPPWWDFVQHVCFLAAKCTDVGQSCGGGLTCTDTPDGPYCLDPRIPFTDP